MQQDDKIRELLSGTKLKAGENLKYRIMHQIETETALSKSKKKVNKTRPLIGNMITIFGIIYGLIVLLGLTIYLTGGKDALSSIAFFAPVVLIASAGGLFWMISIYDDRRRSNKRTNS